MFLHFCSSLKGLIQLSPLCCRELLSLFTTSELIQWRDLVGEYEAELRNQPATNTAGSIFSSKTDEGNKRWKDLKVRCVEHVSKQQIVVCRRSEKFAVLQIALLNSWPLMMQSGANQSWNWVNMSYGNGLLPDDPKPLPNPYWLVISEDLWHPPLANLTGKLNKINHAYMFEHCCIINIIQTSLRSQGVNPWNFDESKKISKIILAQPMSVQRLCIHK